jgi:hypothetical protein
MDTWRELERDFREIPNPYGGLRADGSYQDGLPNPWILADGAFFLLRNMVIDRLISGSAEHIFS